MTDTTKHSKRSEWLRRYIPGEVLGTLAAVVSAWVTYEHTHSYLTATAAGWVGEGIGFFGYFIVAELISSSQLYIDCPFAKRVALAISAASTNLLVEFLPAELLDSLIVRPFAMFIAPQYIHPYPVGFLVGKFSADILFYAIAILGYEARKRWLHR